MLRTRYILSTGILQVYLFTHGTFVCLCVGVAPRYSCVLSEVVSPIAVL